MYKSIILLLILSLFACEQKDTAINEISKDKMLEYVKTLASDEFEGRAPATEGGKKSIKYITDHFKKVGVKPIDGKYTQKVGLVRFQKNIEKSFVKIKNGRKNLAFKSDGDENSNFTFWSSNLKPSVDIKEAEIVFVGYGVEAPEHNWDDFGGMDLKGKVLLMLNNDPQVMKDGKLDPDYFKGEARTYYGRYTYKFEQAMKHGAVGAILVHTTYSAGYGYNILGNSGTTAHFAIDVPGTGYQLPFLAHVDSITSNKMAQTFGKTVPELFEMANKVDFKPVKTKLTLSSHIETEISKTETENIFGMIEGTDPVLKDQYLVFSAHYDHLGAHGEGEDHIFNGAWDNAAGTASIMNLAEAFIKKPTKRSMIFFACAAEESGILGSQFFTENPPVKLNKMIANINIDMPNVHGESRDIAAVGVNASSVGDYIKEESKKIMVEGKPLVATDDPNPNAGLMYRSDQVHFAKKGIPAVFVMSGVDYIGKEKDFNKRKMAEVYHKVGDEVDGDWDISVLERDIKIMYNVAKRIGNDKKQPKWHAGNEFESRYNELYKK
jgi:Zn-dependent M28 family amino/carboxypeptidase